MVCWQNRWISVASNDIWAVPFFTFSHLKDLTRNMNRGLPLIFHPALQRTRKSLDERLRIHVLRHTSSPRFPSQHSISIDLQASRDYQPMNPCHVMHVYISGHTCPGWCEGFIYSDTIPNDLKWSLCPTRIGLRHIFSTINYNFWRS